MTHPCLSERRAPVLFHFWPSCLRFSVHHLHDCPHNTLSVHHEHRAEQVRFLLHFFYTFIASLQPLHVLPVGIKLIKLQKALCSFPRCSVVVCKARLMLLKDVEWSLAALKEGQEGSVTCRIIASEQRAEQGKKKILICLLMLPFLWAVSSNCW